MRTGKIESPNTINKLWTVAYDSGELAAATTSITISGLNGDVDEEYQLIIRKIGGSAAACDLRIFPNNDTTAANYGRQTLYSLDSESGASSDTAFANGLGLSNTTDQNKIDLYDISINAKSGYIRTSINKMTNNISGTTVIFTFLTSLVWNNTVDNITSFVISSDVTNGIGIGSRIILLKKVKLTTGIKTGKLNIQGSIKGTWETIYSNTLASAATSVTISNLTGNSDVLYRLRMRVVNGYAGTITVAIRPNNDTGANYGYQRIYGENTTVAASRDTGNDKIYTLNTSNTSVASAEELFYAKAGYVRTFLSQDVENAIETTIGDIVLKGQSWNNTADEITSLVIYANQANGLGIGTEIILERLNL